MWQPSSAPRHRVPGRPRGGAQRSDRRPQPDLSAATATSSPTTSPVPCGHSTAMTSSSGTVQACGPLIKDLKITTTVPGGAQDATCFADRRGAPLPARRRSSPRGRGHLRPDQCRTRESVSIGVKITPGLVADSKPHGAERLKTLTAERVGAIALAAVTLLITVGAPIVGMLWWRKNGRDQRYADLAPGTVPFAGQEARIVPNDPDIPIRWPSTRRLSRLRRPGC